MSIQECNLDTLAATVRVNYALCRDASRDRFAAIERIGTACYEAEQLGVDLPTWMVQHCGLTLAEIQPLQALQVLADYLTDEVVNTAFFPIRDESQPRQPLDRDLAFLAGLASVTPGFDSIVGDTAVKIAQQAAVVAFDAAMELPFACSGRHLDAVRSNFASAVIGFTFRTLAKFIAETTGANELFPSVRPDSPSSIEEN